MDAVAHRELGHKSGPATAALVAGILERRRHPEQGYRAALGIIRLGERHGTDRCEAARARRFAWASRLLWPESPTPIGSASTKHPARKLKPEMLLKGKHDAALREEAADVGNNRRRVLPAYRLRHLHHRAAVPLGNGDYSELPDLVTSSIGLAQMICFASAAS